MSFTLTMPKLSPTMESGVIAKWHVKEGDFVDAGQLVMEVATDKATVEYNAIDPGFLRKIVVLEGQEAKVNDPLAILTETKEGPFEEKVVVVPPKQAPAVATFSQAQVVVEAPSQERVFASPLARKLAKDRGFDLTQCKGTGPSGRIMSRDLKPDVEEIQGAKLEPLSLIRKVIATKLQAAKVQIPHFYVRQKVDVTRLLELRQELKEVGVSLTINDFIVKAVAFTLQEHPKVNSGFSEKEQAIIRFDNIDISIAVDIDEGLITPIVAHADQRHISEISSEIKELAEKAKRGKLAPKEFQGGSFTISNLGMFGISDFSAIINPPQAAILAVGGMEKVLQKVNETLLEASIITVTLSVDHRVIDGAEAAKFLQTLKKFIEAPALLLM